MASTKIPLRSIGKLLTNLDPSVRSQLEAAFVEAEDLNTLHNDAAIAGQTKRVLSSLVSAPVITVDTNISGYDVNWSKLRDRLISFYEVQVSLQSNFGSYQSFKTVDNFFSAEGVTSDTFIRVRAIRWDGKCGNYSNILHVPATALSSPMVYARDLSDIPSFYIENPNPLAPNPVQHLFITPQRKNGGVMVFGSFGAEFYVDQTGIRGEYADTDPDSALDDAVSVTVNGAHVNTLHTIPITDSGDVGSSPVHRAAIGYSVGFGPAFLSHSEFYFSTYDNWPHNTTQNAGHTGGGVHDGWNNLKGIQGQVEAQITNSNDSGSYYTILTQPGGTSATTNTLTGKKFFFNLPNSRTVKGIEVKLYGEGQITLGPGTATITVNRISLVDNGTARPTNKASGEDFILGLGPNNEPQHLTYGGATDLWGEIAGFWTSAKINDKDFGVVVQFTIDTTGGDVDSAVFVYGLEVLVHTDNSIESATIDVIYIPSTQDLVTYPGRRVVLTNCTLNAIEFGDDIT